MECIVIVQPACVPIREMWQLGRDTIIYQPAKLSQGWSIGDGSGPGRPVKGYDMTSLQTVPCHIAGMLAFVLLEEKMVSNSLIDLQNLLVKALIHIAL